MKTIAFFGGSNVTGAGYIDGMNCKDIYPNIVASQGYNIQNHCIPGASMYEIFFTCMQKLVQDPVPDVIVIEWNIYPRYKFHPSPEVELTVTASNFTLPDNWSHCIPISSKQIAQCHKTLLLLDGDFHRMTTLLDYCIIIQSICKLKNIKLAMLASDVLWSEDLFKNYTIDSNLDSCLSKHSKELLDFDNRDDADILHLLSVLKERFDQVNSNSWALGSDTIKSLLVDLAPVDRTHPGPVTMKIVADRITNFLTEKNL
jgi:hypothetical protein